MLTELQEEQASLYALDLLDESAVTTFQREMLAKPELQLLVEDLRLCRDVAVLNSVAQTPPPGLKSQVLARIASLPSTPKAPVSLPSKTSPPKEQNISLARLIVPWALAACLTITMVWLYKDRETVLEKITRLETRIIQQEQTLRALKTENAAKTKTIAQLESQNLVQAGTIAQLRATSPEAGPWSNSTVSVVWDKNRQEGVLVISQMPEAESGKTYQLWAIDPKAGAPVSAGVFQVRAGESIRIVFKTVTPVKDAAQFAVSLEEGGAKEAPQGPVILAGASL